MLTCVPPLSLHMVAHFLKNIIKAFLATFIGIPFLGLCRGAGAGRAGAGLVRWPDSEEEGEEGGAGGGEKAAEGGPAPEPGRFPATTASSSVPDLQRSI